jgi:hypothetical protein
MWMREVEPTSITTAYCTMGEEGEKEEVQCVVKAGLRSEAKEVGCAALGRFGGMSTASSP